MPVTTNLGLAVSSNQQDYVLEYWMKMLNESNGNFVLLDNEFGTLASKLAFTIYPASWVAEEHAPFYYKSTVTIAAVVADNSIVEAYFENILISTGVILHSVTQNGTNLELVFYADSAKQSEVKGFIKYVYSVPGQAPLPVPSATIMPKTITANGTYNAHDDNADGYSPLSVNVVPNVSSKTITANGTYSASTDNVDGYSQVNVNVPDSGMQMLNGQLMSYSLPSGAVLKDYAFISQPNLRKVNLNGIKMIPSVAFSGDYQLQQVTGVEQTKRINYAAFQYCSKLSEANFPKCYYLDQYAFLSCSNLSSISFPNLLYMSEYAFNGCSKFPSVASFPNLLYMYGNYAFAYCSLITSVYFPNIIEMRGHLFGNVYNIQLQSGLSFPLLVNAGPSCFRSCGLIENFYAPFMDLSNASGFFYQCYNLKSVDVRYASSAINVQAFYQCSMLSDIFVPMVALIYGSAFESCISLSQATLGGSIGISATAFRSCYSLETLNLLTVKVPNLNNINAFQSTPMSDASYLGRYGSIYVPSQAVASFKAATNWTTYSDRIVALDSSYDSRFVYAEEFNNRIDLTTIPSEKLGAEYILQSAFNGCLNISEVNLPLCKAIGHLAFYNCGNISSISLPNCEYICDAFRGINNSNVTEIYLPKAKRIKGQFGFTSASVIDLPECTVLENSVFSGFTYLRVISVPQLKYIGTNCFARCFRLESISLPECLMISSYAFSSCSALQNISLPECLLLGESAFAGCSSLTYAYLPKVGIVSGYAFQSCRWLSSVYMPNITSIPVAIFQSCQSLASFDFANITYIGTNAFEGCVLFSRVNLPRVSVLWGRTFQNCVLMSKFYAANLIMLSNNYNFNNCQKLESVYLPAKTVAQIYGSHEFSCTPMLDSTYLTPNRYGSVYVPAELLSDYKNDSQWSWFSDRLVGLTDSEFQNILDHWDD